MDMESMGHVFDRWSFLSLKIDVSFLNQMIMGVIRNNILMVFYQCLHEACGTYSILGMYTYTHAHAPTHTHSYHTQAISGGHAPSP